MFFCDCFNQFLETHFERKLNFPGLCVVGANGTSVVPLRLVRIRVNSLRSIKNHIIVHAFGYLRGNLKNLIHAQCCENYVLHSIHSGPTCNNRVCRCDCGNNTFHDTKAQPMSDSLDAKFRRSLLSSLKNPIEHIGVISIQTGAWEYWHDEQRSSCLSITGELSRMLDNCCPFDTVLR